MKNINTGTIFRVFQSRETLTSVFSRLLSANHTFQHTFQMMCVKILKTKFLNILHIIILQECIYSTTGL
jgi:hypothetical protein